MLRLLLLLSLLSAPALAQTRGQRAPAQGAQLTDAQLRQQFRENFLRGCTAGRTPGVRNQNNYCNCYANSYLARYDGRTLAAAEADAATPAHWLDCPAPHTPASSSRCTRVARRNRCSRWAGGG